MFDDDLEELDLLDRVQRLESVVIARATHNTASDSEYVRLRGVLLNDPIVGKHLPRWIRTFRDLSQFWSFIKRKFDNYAERREFIWSEFEPAVAAAETGAAPADELVADGLTGLDSELVRRQWTSALDRRASDPEGAITIARTLLESVCKHILDDAEKAYPDSVDLPKLYKQTAETLSIAPTQHTEDAFKQILGGCASVVNGLATLRNRLSDSHGRGSRVAAKPSARHAELAVNLAGAMATFLVATWEARTS